MDGSKRPQFNNRQSEAQNNARTVKGEERCEAHADTSKAF